MIEVERSLIVGWHAPEIAYEEQLQKINVTVTCNSVSLSLWAMSEYWVSKKKYFCKYCDIYITDDIPSRQQHENGLRHKGNVERFVRGIYKAGEKHKKDLEEEKREMRRVEQASSSSSCFVQI